MNGQLGNRSTMGKKLEAGVVAVFPKEMSLVHTG